MTGKIVYTHGPHKGSLQICEELSIKASQHVKFDYKFIPRRVGWADHYFLEGVVPLVKGVGYAKNAPIIIKGNCHYAYYAKKSAARKLILKSKLGKQSNMLVLAVSAMSRRDYLELGFKNVIVCEGFMYRNYDSLVKIKPADDNFCFIGQNGYLKGLDRSIACFIELKKQGIIAQKTEFLVAGDHTNFVKQLHWSDIDYIRHKVRFIGPIDDLSNLFGRCRFQLHLARYEPNAVSIMEGMAAGLLPILSDNTGNVDHIKESGFDPCVYSYNFQKTDYERIAEIVSAPDTLNLKEFAARYSCPAGRLRWRENYEAFLCSH